MGTDSKQILSNNDIDLAVEALKEVTNNRTDWTQEEKERYKNVTDLLKEGYKAELNGDMNEKHKIY